MLESEAAEAQKNQPPLVAGLTSFMLHPKDRHGTLMIKDKLEHFEHVVKYARRMTDESTVLLPSDYLAVDVRSDQKSILNPSVRDYTEGAMMRAAGGIGAQMNAPKRKIDALCGIRGHSGLLNDPERMKKLREQSDLAQSIVDIQRSQQQEKKAKKEAGISGLIEKGPESLKKLRAKDLDASKLSMDELHSIASRYFATTLAKSKKSKLVEDFEALVAARPDVLTNAIAAATTRAPGSASDDKEGDEDAEHDGGSEHSEHSDDDE